jgi:hypothetical protein
MPMEKLSQNFRLDAQGPVEWGVNRFPDGQIQFWMIDPGKPVRLWASLPDPESVDLFFQMVSATEFGSIQINYLYGARSDKDRAGDRIVANVAKQILDRLRTIPNLALISPHCGPALLGKVPYGFPIHPEILANEPGYGLILFPDASAERRFAGLIPGIPTVTCLKQRDQITGQIVRHEIPPIAAGSKILILDDLCDGGRTFLEAAEFIPEPRHCDLYITHGVFSNGAVPRLLEVFERIWVTNSLPSAKAASEISDRISLLDIWS